jgi:hypothetical protein
MRTSEVPWRVIRPEDLTADNIAWEGSVQITLPAKRLTDTVCDKVDRRANRSLGLACHVRRNHLPAHKGGDDKCHCDQVHAPLHPLIRNVRRQEGDRQQSNERRYARRHHDPESNAGPATRRVHDEGEQGDTEHATGNAVEDDLFVGKSKGLVDEGSESRELQSVSKG